MATKQANPKATDGDTMTQDANAAAPAGSEGGQGPMLKKKEFLDRVADRSGVRKGDAKTAIEAALAVLGEALANGEEVNLPPLGKIKVARQKTTPRGIAYNLRLVRNAADLTGVAEKSSDD